MADPLEIGREQMVDAVGGGNENVLDRLVRDTGIYGLSYFIGRVLDEHYPVDIFGDDTSAAGIMYGVNWGGEQAGEDIPRGVKWAVLLRHAIRQIERKP